MTTLGHETQRLGCLISDSNVKIAEVGQSRYYASPARLKSWQQIPHQAQVKTGKYPVNSHSKTGMSQIKSQLKSKATSQVKASMSETNSQVQTDMSQVKPTRDLVVTCQSKTWSLTDTELSLSRPVYISLYYVAFYAVMTSLFCLSIWVLMYTLDPYAPDYQDRLKSPGSTATHHNKKFSQNLTSIRHYLVSKQVCVCSSNQG